MMREEINAVRRALDRLLANNHFEIELTVQKTGREFAISAPKKCLVMADKEYREDGEEVWKTEIGWFPSTYEVAGYLIGQGLTKDDCK